MANGESRKLGTILLVEGDSDLRESLAGTLARAGYAVDAAASPAAALASLRARSADVTLVALDPGAEEGASLVRDIGRLFPATVCVIMTAEAGPDAAVQAIRAGAYDCLARPVETEDLLATLARCFERVNLQREREEARTAELQALNERLRESEQRYREVFESTSDGIFVLDVEAGGEYRVVTFNRAEERVTGMTAASVVGRRLQEFLPPQTVQAVRRHYDECVAAASPISYNEDLDLPAGKRAFFTTLIPVKGDDGRVHRIIGVARDVTETRRMQTALRESEEFYREVFDKISDGIFVVDVTSEGRYRLVSYNAAQAKMVGVSAEDAVGRFSDEYLPPSVAAQVNADNRQCIEAGVPMTFDRSLDLPAGRSHFQTTLVPVWNAEGRIHRLIGVARDVTESRRQEAALKSSEEKFSRAFAASPASSVISRLADGVLIEVNPAFERGYGYTREEVIGRTALSAGVGLWIDEADRARLVAELREKGRVDRQEVPFRHKSGAIRYSQVSWRIIEVEDTPCILSIALDVTERRRMEKELRESESRFRLLAENSTDMISRHTPDGVYLYASPACRALLGYEPEELVGRSAYDFFHPDDMPPIAASHAQVVAREAPSTLVYRIRRKDGSYTWFESISRSIRDPATGGVLEIQASSRDVSGRIEAQERERDHERQLFQAAKLASLGTLVSGIAHEINNPNNFIRLNVQSILELWPEARNRLAQAARQQQGLALRGIPLESAGQMVQGLLQGIEEGSRRIEKLVVGLRDFARGDEGELTDVVDLNAVVRSAVMIVRELINKTTRSFAVEDPQPLPPIRGNYHQIEQVVLNLLTNACQSLKDPDRAISIATRFEPEAREVVLAVTDEGQGIPPEILHRITDPFFTTKRSTGGSGLGLAVSSRIVANHGGRMSFDSVVGRGTVATVRFPAAGAER